MNTNTISSVGANYPTNHPFQVATSTYKTITTPSAWSYATTTGPVLVSTPTVGAILGSSTPQDACANPAILSDAMGQYGRNRGQSRPYYCASSFDGFAFKVRATGTSHIVAGAGVGGCSFRVALYLGTSATASSDILVPGTNATVINIPASKTANLNFMVEATLLWDSTSLMVTGTCTEVFGGYNVTDTAAITPILTGPALASSSLTAATYDALSFVPFFDFTVNAPTSASTVLKELVFERI